MSGPIRIALVTTLASFALATSPLSSVANAKKTKPACGITYLPLVEGNQWTYEPFESPEAVTDDQQKQIDSLQRSASHQPKLIKILVEKVVPEGKTGATITLKETIDDLVISTTIRCTATRLEISPQSFFFAAEPGGGLGMKIEKLTRTGTSFPGKKGFRKRGEKTTVEIKGDILREATADSGAKLSRGKLELERTVTIVGPSPTSTPAGSHKKATRIYFEVSGRVAVEPMLDKSIEMPLGVQGSMWFQPGVGMVQARNRVGHWFQLVDGDLK